MKHKVCIKCNSNEIISAVKVLGNRFEGIPFNYLSIEIFENPNAVFKKQRKNFKVQAWVCTDCGYVEFYVVELESLKSSYQIFKSNQKK